jgi:ectoine hydroxylase-related dioxygenase (phytanoyl-CoA dioxygenase family)
MEANRYVGDTSWHPDHSANYNAPGCRFAFYLDPLQAATGALRIIAGSHAPPLHDAIHEAHQRRGGPGHTTEGVSAELGCEREEDVPCHVCVSEPGDLVVFDQGCFHAAFGGSAGRRMCAAVFYLVPRTEREECALRARAEVNNAALASQQIPGYHAAWVANEAGSERRAKWISCLHEYGFDLGA